MLIFSGFINFFKAYLSLKWGQLSKKIKLSSNTSFQLNFQTERMKNLAYDTGAPNKNIVQNNLNIALLNVF